MTILRAILGYFFLLLTVRVLRRRPGGQMTPFEFVIVFLVGGVIILATVGQDKSVTNCTCAILAIGLMHRLVAWVKSVNPKIGAVIDGTPLVLYQRGEWHKEVVEGMHIDEEDVLAAGRIQDVRSIDEIDTAVLERNGTISIIKAEK